MSAGREIAVTRKLESTRWPLVSGCMAWARTRFMGLNRNLTFHGLAAMAGNIRKGAEFLTPYGIRELLTIGLSAPEFR